MIKKTLLALLVAGYVSPVLAEDFDLSDLVPATAASAEITTVDTSNTREVDDVIFAENAQSGVLSAHQSLVEDGEDGVKMIAVGSGIGILSTGSSYYNNYDNRNATLLSKRGAYTKAFQIAKKQLVENFEGMNSACTTVSNETMDVIDTGNDSVANTFSSISDTCTESVKGALAGYVTFDVYDDPEEGFVRVSLISTPKTREQTKRQSGALTETTNPNEIFKQVITDLKTGILPPVGAKVLTHPETQETYVLGFGSSIIRENSSKAIQRKMLTLAKNQSQTKARNALLATMQGEQVYWAGGFSENQMESNEQFEYAPDSLNPADAKALGETKNSFINNIKMTDSYSTFASGKLPQGVSVKSFKSTDGDWMLSVAVYAPSLEASAAKAAKQNEKRVKESSGSSSKINVDGGLSDSNNANKGPSGQVSNAQDL
ncbi:hypothetical protein G5S52_09360 [Grimontia sp. S25]|uniref:Uncharacterized protein n=1 Tax=Grimontia sedimenti TaxID=2711294 RepID=A0A6M1RP74_9GAMM|nr:hypothetical protein [Grimontia sedimenti]NGN97857.1 hypothetical protein [Grimontia sedimenti]